MRRLAPVILLALALSAFSLSCSTAPTAARLPSAGVSVEGYTLSELQQDFTYCAQTIMARNPLVNADRAALSSFIDRQRTRLRDGMGRLELYRVLSPIVAMVGCGHSGIRFPSDEERSLRDGSRYLPFRVYVIKERMYVVSPFSAPNPAAGAEITAINGMSVTAVIDTLLTNITADGKNLTKKYSIMNQQFSELYRLFIGSPDRFTVDYLDSKGSGSVELSGISWDDLVYQLSDPSFPDPGNPLDYSVETKSIAMLRIRSFNFYDPRPLAQFKSFIDGTFQAIKNDGITSLILDLRDNGGGDPNATSYLLSHLIQEPAPYFSQETQAYDHLKIPLQPAENAFAGRLFVLINGASFSSTGHLCSLLKYHKRAVFIGEESGGTYSCTDNSRDFPLPVTGLILRYSTQEFSTAVMEIARGHGIPADHEVVPTVQDIINGRDVVKDYAIDLAGR